MCRSLPSELDLVLVPYLLCISVVIDGIRFPGEILYEPEKELQTWKMIIRNRGWRWVECFYQKADLRMSVELSASVGWPGGGQCPPVGPGQSGASTGYKDHHQPGHSSPVLTVGQRTVITPWLPAASTTTSNSTRRQELKGSGRLRRTFADPPTRSSLTSAPRRK